MAKKTAAHRLDDARIALATTTKQVTEIEMERNAALLADNDDLAVKLFGKLETLRAAARGHTDKIALLEAAAERENADRIIRGHQALIGRFEKTLAGSDTDLTEGADLIGQAWKKITSGITKRDAALAAFNVHSSHARAAATSIDGCAMSGEAIIHLLSYEFYRISARPLLGGRPGERARPHLPGAKPPNLQIALMPDKITPFPEKLRTASAFAVKTLRDEIGNSGEVAAPVDEPPPTSAPPSTNGAGAPRSAADIQREIQAAADARDAMLPPDTDATGSKQKSAMAAEQRERTTAEVELDKLLQRQMKLSQDVSPAGEAAYLVVVGEIARVSQQIETEKAS